MNQKSFIIIIIIGILLMGGLFAFIVIRYTNNTQAPNNEQQISSPRITSQPTITTQRTISPAPLLSPTPTIKTTTPTAQEPIKQSVHLQVPFISQAPLKHWENPIYQDSCEEASLLMAYLWLNEKTMSNNEAEQELYNMAQFELEHYGNFHDTSAQDTAIFMNEYFQYENVIVEYNIDENNIKQELSNGNVVIVPANGRLLNNPNFTSPGPLYHMLMIIGYDESTKQFITNDPGTQFGKDYRYSYSTLMNAIRDYETGYHQPIPFERKAMIVVRPR